VVPDPVVAPIPGSPMPLDFAPALHRGGRASQGIPPHRHGCNSPAGNRDQCINRFLISIRHHEDHANGLTVRRWGKERVNADGLGRPLDESDLVGEVADCLEATEVARRQVGASQEALIWNASNDRPPTDESQRDAC
jgi:hypothetical protein